MKCSLHGFDDVNLKAYYVVIYFVCEADNDIYTVMFTSKTRESPVKSKIIPRIELVA